MVSNSVGEESPKSVRFRLCSTGTAVCYAIFSPYYAWYFIVPNARLTVDGKPQQGLLHRGNHGATLFLTRSSAKAESHMIWVPHDRQGMVSNCGRWTVPRFPAFPIGDLNPPCWIFLANEAPTPKPALPPRNPSPEERTSWSSQRTMAAHWGYHGERRLRQLSRTGIITIYLQNATERLFRAHATPGRERVVVSLGIHVGTFVTFPQVK